MMIKVNEKKVELREGLTLFHVRKEFKPLADVMIVNGFPVISDMVLKDGDSVFLIKRGERPSAMELEHLMISRHTPGVHNTLKKATVGIAGVGGLGSTVAVALARVGIGSLVLADFDVVEPSNLNRQQFFIDQIGMYKVEAMKENLGKINPYIAVNIHNVILSPENIPQVFAGCGIVIEAFDRADMKAMLIDTLMERMPDVYVIAASGLAGYGPNNTIRTRRLAGRLYIVGDMVSEARQGTGLMAPRVSIAAAQQANQAVRIILGEEDDGSNSKS